MESRVLKDDDEIDHEVARLNRRFFPRLRFPGRMEMEFERNTRQSRSHRLWIEGMVAIAVLVGCLALDYVLVHDARWKWIVVRTMFVIPIALLVNLVVQRNPVKWVREGAVAASMTLICLVNLWIEGNATATSTTYGLICVLISVSFTDLVMRIRLPYAGAATVAMSLSAVWFIAYSNGLDGSAKVVAASLVAMGIAITTMTGYRLEREERLTYLLQLRTKVEAQSLSESNVRLQELSNVDTLTSLPNRRAFESRLAELWAEGKAAGTSLSAFFLDVDDFKTLNDRDGHLYGDRVLRRIGELFPQGLRGPQDFAARFGGDEFVVLLPNTQIATAQEVAERLRLLVELPGTSLTVGQEALLCRVSCGVAACVPGDNVAPDDLLRAADRALYRAKLGGRNRIASQ